MYGSVEPSDANVQLKAGTTLQPFFKRKNLKFALTAGTIVLLIAVSWKPQSIHKETESLESIATPNYQDAQDTTVDYQAQEYAALALQDTPSYVLEEDTSQVDTERLPSNAPHLILITLDDVGYNDVGWQSTDMPDVTPHMTKMANHGVILSNYYGQPSCSPARATLMSGRFIHRTGFQDIEVAPYSNYTLDLSMTLLPAALSTVGYRTYGIGKWNIGHCNEDYLPWHRGFDSFLAMTTAGIGYFMHDHGSYTMHRRTSTLYDLLEGDSTGNYTTGGAYYGKYDTIVFGERATELIKHHVKYESMFPIFIWLAFHGAHSDKGYADETVLSDDNIKYLEVLKDSGTTDTRMLYARALMALDNTVKTVVEALRQGNMINNTVMVVHSDNGAQPCVSEMAGSNWPLRSCKFQYFEGGVRLPAFVYAPGILTSNQTGTKYHGLMHHVDWYTTFLSLAKYSKTELWNALDGVDHWDAIGGVSPAPRKEIVLDLSSVAVINHTRLEMGFEYAVIAYIYAEMKLLQNVPNDIWYHPNTTYPSTCVGRTCKMSGWMNGDSECGWSNFLFNLTEDPYERNNLYYDPAFAAVRRDLMSRVEERYVKEHIQSVSWGDDAIDRASKAFREAGDYVVPWGCGE